MHTRGRGSRRSRTWSMCATALTGLFLLSVVTAGQSPRVDDAVLKGAGKTGEDWLTYGLSQSETRFSPLDEINTTNVSRLGLSWSYDLGPGGGGQEATPLVWNGTIYGITNWSVVFAVDARTGKERWRWDPEVNQTAVRPKNLLRRRQSRSGDLPGEDLRARHRRQAAGPGCGDWKGHLGIARRFSARPIHDHHGASYCQGQSDHWCERWRSADSRIF